MYPINIIITNMNAILRFYDKIIDKVRKLPTFLSCPLTVCVNMPFVICGVVVYIAVIAGSILLSPVLIWCFCHSICDDVYKTNNESITDAIKRWFLHDVKWCCCAQKK
jgi:hypothetical protein